MNSRRSFLINGSLATTALLATKSFSAFAGITSPFAGYTGKHSSLVFLHTMNINPVRFEETIQYIAHIKKNNAGTMLLNAGQDVMAASGKLDFDASVSCGHNNFPSTAGDYRIINKAGIRTGVINAKPGDADVIKKINDLSSYLKAEGNCQLIICISQLGYKNKNAPDDLALAASSTCLDVIIGGHSSNFASYPVVALNKTRKEVIIHCAAGNNLAVGKIEIGFDEKGRKKQINFNDSLLKIHDKSRAKLTA